MKTQIKLLTAALALAAASAQAAVDIQNTTGVSGSHITIGSSSSAPTNLGIAIGNNSIVDISSHTGSGPANAAGSIALGNNAHTTNHGSITIGASSTNKARDAIAVGVYSETQANYGTAIGAFATVLDGAVLSTALGVQASVHQDDLLTSSSTNNKAAFTDTVITDRGVVSVGQSAAAKAALATTGTTRIGQYQALEHTKRIINVQDGVKDTDALNVRQAKALNTALEGKISGLDTRITTNTNNITALTGRVDDAEDNIGNLDTRVTALEAGGAAGSARVNQRLDNLENRVDTVERRANDGAALAMATAVMVQPPAGQNALMVGTGFYRGSNAIAVGYGHTGNGWGLKAAVSAAGRGNFGGGVGASLFW